MDDNKATIAMLERRVAREIKARKQSEEILNQKSLELYKANLALVDSNQALDLRVKERTQALELAKKNAEQQLALNENANDRFTLAMLASSAGIWEKNIIDDTWYFSDRLIRLLGYNEAQLIECFDQFSFVHPQDLRNLKSKVIKHVKRGAVLDVECRILTGSGYYKWFWIVGQAKWNAKGKFTRIAGSFSDIDERVENAKTIQKMAHYDHLTQIPNRELFNQQLDTAIELARAQQSQLAVLLIDLNDFKLINDSLGHSVGDKLLQHVAHMLKQSIGPQDLVSRLGGDEFSIVLKNITDTDQLIFRCRNILKEIEIPNTDNANSLRAKISIGVALYPEHGVNRGELLSNADLAMYQAKKTKSKGSQFYLCEQSLIDQLATRSRIGKDIYKAIKNREFYMMYQPFVELASGTHYMVESLVRWQHPTLGLISPVDFIPIAEESGLIVELGELIIEMVISKVPKLMQGNGLGRLSINISAAHFLSPGFLRVLTENIDKYPGSAKHLCIEITESVVLDNLDLARVVIDKLHRLGLLVSLDDFGTGYSSLSYLQILSVDSLKLDRSFIADIDTCKDRRTITESIIKLAHSLNLYVVAEGVENSKQLDYLLDYKCNYVQGNYFYEPLNEDQLLEVQVDSLHYEVWNDEHSGEGPNYKEQL